MTDPSNVVPAHFVARPNRFIVQARLSDGRQVDAHLGDPGRLVELLPPEAELRLRPAPPGSTRKTPFSVTRVRAPGSAGVWVSLEPGRANALAESLLRESRVDGLAAVDRQELRREVRHGESRFDFRLGPDEGPHRWIEVKAVTFVRDRTGRFPDAPTARGRRHVEELTRVVTGGAAATVLFVALREDVDVIEPYREIDAPFADALGHARSAGVELRGVRFAVDDGDGFRYAGPVPVRLSEG